MKLLIIPLIFLVAILQLCSTYLWYLSFKPEMSQKETIRLLQLVLSWWLISLPLYFGIFTYGGFTIMVYKALLIFGWIPYFLIFLRLIPDHISLHIFVLGMTALWSFLLHSISDMGLTLWFYETAYDQALIIHTLSNLILFFLLLPWEQKMFSRLLPSREFFQEKNIGLYIASLPLSISIAQTMMSADKILWHSWEILLSRFYLLVVFLCCFHYVQIAAKRYNENKLLQKNNQHLSNEMVSLVEHRLLLQKSKSLLKKFRQGFLTSYDHMLELIDAQKDDEIREYLKQQELKLPAATVMSYSDYPIINTAISIYYSRAQRLGINFTTKVNLPDNLATDENDLGILLSNLLENALQASLREPKSNGTNDGIVLTVQHNGHQCVISLGNPCATPINLDDEGLPRATRKGHGIGMVSLKMFLEKYNGYATFTQDNGWVRLFIYWRDEQSC